MDRQSAINLIEDTFNNPFDELRFTKFVLNIFNDIDQSKAFEYHGQYIPDSYKNHVKKYKRIGKYIDSDNNELDVLTVHLIRETSLERARTMQRNFTAWYLKNRGEKDAAVVAYHTDNLEDWRFSFVRMEYKTDISVSGKIKVKEDITPARRYSFLVGKNEPNHTAQEQLIPILQDDYNNPTLSEIEKAFSVEKVAKQFYLDYRKLFENLTKKLNEILDKDYKIKTEFETKSIDPSNFTKKLMGQIVFLYFLQKKGWLGVGKDEKGDLKPWGTGPKNFLRQLFEKKLINYRNFFNDVLEPLFYEALALEHTNNYYSLFDCKIPFLNGGLFEPINDYNWQETDILIPNNLFSNTIRTGTLDVFDRYNFTVREDEPLEKEVAVDPEMLGKVFENLLPENLRKGKGTYYTPREIVHYMCQESLINYLDTEVNTGQVSLATKKPIQEKIFEPPEPEQMSLETPGYKPVISRKDIEEMVRKGEFALEYEQTSFKKFEENENYSGIYGKPIIPKMIRFNAPLIDEKLRNIKVCDPAVGSGAFLVGMMHEIVKIRRILKEYISENERLELYDFKRHCIQECIYGVDIDTSAIEIAKLRLWLSLVVDEEDYYNIKPLPNLEYKIMQGNSLIEEFHGISLNLRKKEDENGLKFDEDNELDLLVQILQNKQNEHFNATHHEEIKSLKKEVEDTIIDIFRFIIERKKVKFFLDVKKLEYDLKRLSDKDKETYRTQKLAEIYKRHNFNIDDIEKELREMTHGNKERNFFPWKLYFADIFRSKGGFDVVISNPPYITYKGKQKVVISSEYVKKLISLYPNSAQYKVNSYALFTDRGVNLLKTRGLLSYIIPSTILQNKYLKNIRKYLLSNYHITQIVSFGNKVFEAVTDSIILFVCREFFDNAKTYLLRKDNPVFSPSDEKKIYLQSTWKSADDSVVNLKTSNKDNNILNKIEKESNFLNQFMEVYVGIVAHGIKKFISDKKLTKHYKKYLQGKHIYKYEIHPSGIYINFDVGELHSNTDEVVYLQDEKILVRKTGNILLAAYDDSQFYTDQSIYNLYSKKGNNLNLKYIIAILNSRLMNFYFNKKLVTNPDVFPYIKGIPTQFLVRVAK